MGPLITLRVAAVKYEHAKFTEARERLKQASLTAEQSAKEIETLQNTVREHFRGLAKTYNYTFGFDESGPPYHSLDPYEGSGDGTLFVYFPEGTVMVTDKDGGLHRILEQKRISHKFEQNRALAEQEGGIVELNIDVASEHLEEALGNIRTPGQRLPGQGSWKSRRSRRTTPRGGRA